MGERGGGGLTLWVGAPVWIAGGRLEPPPSDTLFNTIFLTKKSPIKIKQKPTNLDIKTNKLPIRKISQIQQKTTTFLKNETNK